MAKDKFGIHIAGTPYDEYDENGIHIAGTGNPYKNIKSPIYSAPIKTKKKKNGIFKSGAFSDGYQFGDINRTVGGSIIDASLGLLKGVAWTGEKIGTLTAAGIAQVADWAGADNFAEGVRNSIAGKDETTNKLKKYGTIGGLTTLGQEAIDSTSVFDEKADGVIENVGQQAGRMAFSRVGIPWQAITTASTMGSELEDSFSKGVTDWRAWGAAAANAGIEVAGEYISGGIKLPGTGKTMEKVAGKVIDNISNRVIKGIAGILANLGGEGIEEVVTNIGQSIARSLFYDKSEDNLFNREFLSKFRNGYNFGDITSATIDTIINKENLSTFIQSAITTGIMTAGNKQTYTSLKEGRNLVTGYTSNEQNIIDKETDNRLNKTIEEFKSNDKELSQKEIKRLREQIEEDVKNDFSKGLIASNSIEENTSLKTYQNNNINNNIENKQNFSVNSNNSNITRESAYKYFSQDDVEINKTLDIFDTIKTNRSTNDSKLEIEFSDKVPANGMHITEGNTRKIIINPKSENYLEQVFIHELAHDLQYQETYLELKKYIEETAKKDGKSFEVSKKALTEAYKKFYDENKYNFSTVDMDVETTNDMLAMALGNQEYINRLAGEKPSLFKKIYDYFKDVIFGGNIKDLGNRLEKHNRLVKMQDMFEKAYNDHYAKGHNINETIKDIRYLIDEGEKNNIDKIKLLKQELEEMENRSTKKSILSVKDENGNILFITRSNNGNLMLTKKKEKALLTTNEKGKLYKDDLLKNGYTDNEDFVENKESYNYNEYKQKKDLLRAYENGFDNVKDYENYKKEKENKHINSKKEIYENSYVFKNIRKDINPYNDFYEHGDLDSSIYNPQAFIELFKRKANKYLDIEEIHTSSKSGSKFNSSIYLKDKDSGIEIRISNHYLPETPEREYKRSNYKTRWDKEIVFDDETMEEMISIKDENEYEEYIRDLFEDYNSKIVVEDIKFSIPFQKNYSSNGGYDGKSMSNRAREAYDSGEMPLSKWTKNAIINNIMSYNDDLDENLLNKLTHSELKSNFISMSSWHHTGSFYNETNFYELDTEIVENLTNDDIQAIITERIPKPKKTLSKEEKTAKIEQKKLEKQIIDDSKDAYVKFLIIKEMAIPGYKRPWAIMDSIYENNGIYEKAKQMFKEREQKRVDNWERLPEGNYRKEFVKLFKESIEDYYIEEFQKGSLNFHSKEYQNIKSHYSKISKEKNLKVEHSQSNANWNQYLKDNWDLDINKKRTSMKDKLIPIRKDINTNNQTIDKNNNNAPIKNNKEDLIQISKLNKNNANTTPKLPISENKLTNNGNRSSYWNNILNKTDMLTEGQKTPILENKDVKYYESVTNKESLDKASERLKNGGASETSKWFNKDAKDCDSTDVAEGWILLKQYADNGDTAGMVEVAKKMRKIGTSAGQTIQAFNIMSRMTPEGMVKYSQSELSEAFDSMVKNKTKKWIDEHREQFDLTPEEVQFIMDNMKEVSTMEDGYDKRVKLAEIQKLITDKIPADNSKAFKSWIRISMLCNPKTQVRNVAGNALIAPINYFSDMFSSYADKIVAKKTGKRTTGNMNIKAIIKGFKEGAHQATNDYKKGINTRDMEGNRFEIGNGKSFNEKTLIGKSLNRVDSLLNYVMDAGDRVFSESAFENSLENQLVLNNTTEVTQEMIDIARQEALSRTWNDNNEYTKFVLGVRAGLNKLHVGGYGLGDVLIPFAKTPANLTKAIVDYSPLGFIKSIKEGIYLNRSLTNGQYDVKMQHKFVQDLGKATAGSMLYILGLALASAGISTGDSDEDKDTKSFLEKTLGVSSYSIKIGNKSFTYDWAQPLAAPLSITANIVNSKKDKGGALGEAIISNLDTASSVLLEQSFLTGIQEVLNSNGKVVDGMIKQVLDLPARLIPTFSKQIADLVDGTQRTSFEYNNKLKTSINSVKAKIPFLSKTLPTSVDTMGRDIKKYGGNNNIFNVFFNPANVNQGKLSKSAEEIYRVYKEVGDKTIMPRVAPYYINNKNEKIILTAHQKSEYQRISGKIIEDNVKQLLNESRYISLSEEDKSNVIKNIVDYSYNKARKEILGLEMSSSYNRVNKYVSDGGNPYNYYLNKEEIDYSYDSPSKYLVYKAMNTEFDKFTTIRKEISSIESSKDSNGKTITNSRKQKVYDYINKSNLSYNQKLMLAKMEYPSDNLYNNQIINYIDSNKKLSYNEKLNLLKELGFKVSSDGTVRW